MGKWIKSVLSFMIVAFAIYYLYTQPEAAAASVKAVFGIFDSLGRFFSSLAQ